MAVFPSASFGRNALRVRFQEENAAEGINKRWLGMPRGVYLGFEPSILQRVDHGLVTNGPFQIGETVIGGTSGGYGPVRRVTSSYLLIDQIGGGLFVPGEILTGVTSTASATVSSQRTSRVLVLDVDSEQRFSLLRVVSQTERVMVDLFTSETVELDFTGHTAFPVYVLAKADYRTATATRATIFTRSDSTIDDREVLICRVDKVDDTVTVAGLYPETRQPPIAFQGQTYGYMPENAVADLASTIATAAETAAARTSPWSGANPDLATRIDVDLAGAAMTDRLGLRHSNILSNVHEDRSGTSVNVSGSFTGVGRTFEPFLTMEPSGNESSEGAVTDAPRNVCFLIDADTGARIEDSTGEPVFGILTFLDAGGGISGSTIGGSTITLTNADTEVSGTGSPFGAPIEERDLILGGDSNYYEVKTIIGPDDAILGSAYQGPSTTIGATSFRRFTLSFDTVSGGYAGIPTTNIQFLFSAFFRVDRAIYDGFLLIKRAAERAIVEPATTTTPGKAFLAVAGGEVGAIGTIRNIGSNVSSNVHTLNFPVGGASDGGGGVCNVSVVGPVGAQGPGANQGPQGPVGSPGFGYDDHENFLDSPESSSTSATGGTVTLSHTEDMSVPPYNWTGSIAHVTGGWAGFPIGPGFFGYMRYKLLSISKSGLQVTVVGNIFPQPNQSNSTLKLFVGAHQ